MENTLSGILELIIDKLESINDGENKIFSEIKGFPTSDFKGYPSISIIPKGSTGEWLDSARNERTFSFTINLYQEQTPAGRTAEQANEILISCVDSIYQAFDKDNDLGGEVEIVKVVRADFDFRSGSDMPYCFAVLSIEAVALVQNYSE